MAYTPDNPYIPGDPYAYDLKWIVAKVKELIDEYIAQQSEIDDANDAIITLGNDFTDLQNYVNDYFANLDLTAEVNAILQQMYNDGYFDGLINNANLLDNSRFSVNQRGFSTYNANGLTLDRWNDASSVAATIEALDPGVRISRNGGTAILMQKVPFAFLQPGKYTYSVIANGDKYTGTYNISSFASTFNGTWANLPNNWNLDISMNASQMAAGHFVIRIFSSSATAPIELTKIKLEAGEISTIDMDAYDYLKDLTECMKYYQQSWTGSTFPPSPDALVGIEAQPAWTANGTTPVHLYVPMRTTPAITIYSNTGNVNEVRDPADGNMYTVTGASRATPKSFQVGASGTLTAGHIYQFHYKATADL